ncbi:MAG: EamA family transporter [Kibdelosporangium sp.]
MVTRSGAIGLSVLFVLVWSSGYLVGSIGIHAGPPLALAAWRFLVSLVVLGAFTLVTRAPWPSDPHVYVHLMVIGALLQSVQLGAIYLGLGQGVPAGLSSLILSASPLLVAATAVPMFRERLTGRQWIGLTIGLVGVVVSLGGTLTGTARLTGYAFTALALASFAAGTLYQKRFGQSVDLRTGITIQLLGAALTSFPLAALHGGIGLPLTTPAIGSVLWLAMVNSIGGFTLLFTLLRQRSASATTSLLYLVPPVTALLAVPLLHQNLTVGILLSMGISGVGVVLATRTQAATTQLPVGAKQAESGFR